jgi:hypothetical protein
MENEARLNLFLVPACRMVDPREGFEPFLAIRQH